MSKKGNKNKKKGTAFEYRVKAYMVKRGYTVLRARGSLGPADLFCLKPNEKDVAIQCKDVKSNYYSKQEMSEFKQFCRTFDRQCIWAYNFHAPDKKRGRMKFLDLANIEISSLTMEQLAQ